MGFVLLGLGLVLVIEGLVYALAPSLVESLLQALRELTEEQRRMIGFGAIAIGLFCLWLAHALGAVG